MHEKCLAQCLAEPRKCLLLSSSTSSPYAPSSVSPRGRAALLIKRQTVNSLGFEGHVV